MKAIAYLSFAITAYLLFLLEYLYFAGFVGNVAVPVSIDGPRPAAGTSVVDLLVNLGLLLLFGLQHSVMARPWFKRVWTRYVPETVERSVYVLASVVVLGLLMALWRPLPMVVWNISHPVARGLMWGLFAIGWLGVPAVTLLINHFDLFGLRQTWRAWRRQPQDQIPFQVRSLYRFVRHPLYLAWGLAFWATPTMTVGHLLFAVSMTVYMLLAAQIEERDLVTHFGAAYRDYQARVPMFVPRRPRLSSPSL